MQNEIQKITEVLEQDQGFGFNVRYADLMTWVLFLKFVEDFESRKVEKSVLGMSCEPALQKPFRWSDWASPNNGKSDSSSCRDSDRLIEFVENELIPQIRSSTTRPMQCAKDDPKSLKYRLKAISDAVTKCHVSGDTLRKVLNIVDKIDFNSKPKLYELAESYEDCVQRLTNKYSHIRMGDYTPRALVRAILNTVEPGMDESIYNPSSGNCEFFTATIRHFNARKVPLSAKNRNFDANDMFYGREDSTTSYLYGMMNMILHGMDSPNLHFKSALSQNIRKKTKNSRYDIILSNLPNRGAIEWKEILKNFQIQHKWSVSLYMQHIMASLKKGGRAAVIVPEGFLKSARKECQLVRKKLTEEFDIHTILKLPNRYFSPYSGNSSVVYFDNKGRTRDIWNYELNPETVSTRHRSAIDEDFEEFVDLFAKRETSERSWIESFKGQEEDFRLSAQNPSKSNGSTHMVGNFQADKKTSLLDIKSNPLLEVNELFVRYLDIRFLKIRNRQPLDELLDVKTGIELPEGEEFTKGKTKHPYLSSADLNCNGTFDIGKVKFLSKGVFDQLKDHTITEFELFFSSKGTVGKSCVIPPELSGAVLADDASKLVAKDKIELDMRYLHLFTLTSECNRWIKLATRSGKPSKLDFEFFNLLEIPVCPIERQLELVNKVWKIKDEIRCATETLDGQFSNESDAIEDVQKKLKDIKFALTNLLGQAESKKLSNPFSTGGGGAHFEAQVQSLFVTLMLTGGRVSCLPEGIIQKIKLQGKKDGYNTDDLIVYVKNVESKRVSKMLGQVKHSVEFTNGRQNLIDAIQSFWQDFNNDEIFERGKDSFALITGPLRGTDQTTVIWLLEHAQRTNSADEFFRDVEKTNFSPAYSGKKLSVIRSCLENSSEGVKIADEEFYQFLRHFNLLVLDFESKASPILTLVHSLISQFQNKGPEKVWGQIVDEVQSFNKQAGTITREKLPDDIQEAFSSHETKWLPEKFKQLNGISEVVWSEVQDAESLALLALIGKWDDGNENDRQAIEQMIGTKSNDWSQIAKRLLNHQDSPLSYLKGIWSVNSRIELLNQLGGMILESDLKKFVDLAGKVLSVPNSSHDLSVNGIGNGSANGNGATYSNSLKEGVSVGLALLGNHSETLENLEFNTANNCVSMVIEDVLKNATWQQWAFLDRALPNLAEAAPKMFLRHVEGALNSKSCPFSQVFENSGSGSTMDSHLLGLLWALERLAWDKKHFEDACLTLAKLEEYFPSDYESNRPLGSLIEILLPWLPKTQANSKLRKEVIEAIGEDHNDLCWKLLMELLPGNRSTSFGSNKPRLMKPAEGEWKNEVSVPEYLEMSNFCMEMAINEIGSDSSRLMTIIKNLKDFPAYTIDKFIEYLNSCSLQKLPEIEKSSIWKDLREFANWRRRHPNANWKLPIEKVEAIESAAQMFEPMSASEHHKHLFDHSAGRLVQGTDPWSMIGEKLDKQQVHAVKDLYDNGGLDEIMDFVKEVSIPKKVGKAFALVTKFNADKRLIPGFLDTNDDKVKDLVFGYIRECYRTKGWKWIDKLAIATWTFEQKLQFLLCLPFCEETWIRVHDWLEDGEFEYWKQTMETDVFMHEAKDLNAAIEKFIKFDRPSAAIGCLSMMIDENREVDSVQSIRALLANVSSKDSFAMINMDSHTNLRIINHLQSKTDVDENKLMDVEMAYLPKYFQQEQYRPKTLGKRMSADPEFYSEVIQLAYFSTKDDFRIEDNSHYNSNLANNAYYLLKQWNSSPGFEKGKFNSKKFNQWLKRVEEICRESGHIERALHHVGEVLAFIYRNSRHGKAGEALAKILNGRNYGDMRNGFRAGLIYSGGVHWMDPAGKSDKELASQYRKEAEKFEKKGYSRFASKLEEVSVHYENLVKEAESDRKIYEMHANGVQV